MIGSLFKDRYQIESELGSGGIGVVYQARDTLLNRITAIKFLTQANLSDTGRARMLNEARAAASLNHANIIQIFDAGDENGLPYIIMEYVPGESLFEHKPETLPDIISVSQQICLALAHAHAHGIIHRDLKPENVIVTPEGVAKLTDFGLAQSVSSRLSLFGEVIGTVYYISPEQALAKDVDERTDLYALGVMLYEMTSGRLPFDAEDPLAIITQHLNSPVIPPSSFSPEIPAALDDLILQLLSKSREDRPTTAQEVHRALGEALAPYAVHDHEHSLISRLVRGRLFGRDREINQVKQLWQNIQSGSSEQNILLISGEPGVGKTPLVKEIKSLIEVCCGIALVGECYIEEGAPYAPFREITREILRRLEKHAVLVDRPSRYSGLVVSSLLSLAPDQYPYYPDLPTNPPLEPLAEQQRLFDSLYEAFSLLSEHSALLLIVEDLQWADNGSLALLRHIARRSRADHLPVIFVLTYREVELDAGHALNEFLFDINRERLAVRMKLPRFDMQKTHQLLEYMFQQGITSDFSLAIYRETEGNLFYIEEVCKELIEESKLVRRNGRWIFPDDISQIQIPQNIQLSIQARLAKLSPPTLDTLRLGALIGREFDYDVLQAASELDENELIDALEAAVKVELLKESDRGNRFSFMHGLTVQALKTGISGLRQRRTHSRIAAAMATYHPQEYSLLAYHYNQAGDTDRARYYYARAANQAATVFANRDAVILYSEALQLTPADHPERFGLLSARARLYNLIAARTEEESDIQEMLEIAQNTQDDAKLCDALLALAELYLATQHFRARQPASHAAELARKLNDPLREGVALRMLGFEARSRGDTAISRAELEQSVQLFRAAGVASEAAISLQYLSLTLGDLGEHQAALHAAQEALSMSRQAGTRQQEATSLRRLAIAYHNMLQYDQALPNALAALELHEQLGDQSEMCHALNVLGLITSQMGRHAESEAYLRRAIDLSSQIQADHAYVIAFENLTWTYYDRLGTYEDGLAFIEQHLHRAEQTGNDFVKYSILAKKAETLTAIGQYHRALEIYQPVIGYVESNYGSVMKAKVMLEMAYAHTCLGEFAHSRQLLDESMAIASQAGQKNMLAAIYAEFGILAYYEGGETNWQAALETCQQGIAMLRNTEWIAEIARPLIVTAALLEKLDSSADALQASQEAMQFSNTWPVAPVVFNLVHSRALRGVGNIADADQYLNMAYERIRSVAEIFENELYQQSWLDAIPIHRQVLADVAEYLPQVQLTSEVE